MCEIENGEMKFEELENMIKEHVQLAWFYENSDKDPDENIDVPTVLHHLINTLFGYAEDYQGVVLENRRNFIASMKEQDSTYQDI